MSRSPSSIGQMQKAGSWEMAQLVFSEPGNRFLQITYFYGMGKESGRDRELGWRERGRERGNGREGGEIGAGLRYFSLSSTSLPEMSVHICVGSECGIMYASILRMARYQNSLQSAVKLTSYWLSIKLEYSPPMGSSDLAQVSWWVSCNALWPSGYRLCVINRH